MTKRKSLLLCGVFTLLISGYAAWCGRTFFVHPEILLRDDSVPKEAWVAIEAQFPASTLPPVPFDWKVYLRLLMHPHDSKPTPAVMGKDGSGTVVLVTHGGRSFAFRKLPSGSWSYDRNHPLSAP